MYNGNKIKEILRDRGIRFKELNEAMGWKSNNQLRQVVDGNPRADTLEKICDFLEISIDELFTRDRHSEKISEYTEREKAFKDVIEQQKATIDALHELLKHCN